MIFQSLTPSITGLGIQEQSNARRLAVQAFNHVIPLAVIQSIFHPDRSPTTLSPRNGD